MTQRFNKGLQPLIRHIETAEEAHVSIRLKITTLKTMPELAALYNEWDDER